MIYLSFPKDNSIKNGKKNSFFGLDLLFKNNTSIALWKLGQNLSFSHFFIYFWGFNGDLKKTREITHGTNIKVQCDFMKDSNPLCCGIHGKPK